MAFVRSLTKCGIYLSMSLLKIDYLMLGFYHQVKYAVKRKENIARAGKDDDTHRRQRLAQTHDIECTVNGI